MLIKMQQVVCQWYDCIVYSAPDYTEAVVPGSNPASVTVETTLRIGRFTVFTVKSQGREGNLH